MSWLSLVGTLLTVVVGPLLVYFIQKWIKDWAADAATAKRQAAEAQASVDNDKNVADKTRTVNESIDAQQAARDAYKASLGSGNKTEAP